MTDAQPSIVVCSIMRDCEKLLPDYLEAQDRFCWPGLKHVIVEGDSVDGTWEALLRARQQRGESFVVRKLDTGVKQHGSAVHADRFKAMSSCMNLAIDTALEVFSPDYILYLTADLISPPDLITWLLKPDKDVVAPLIKEQKTEYFYDIWAFRKGDDPDLQGPGRAVGCFQATAPYHPAFRPDEVFEVDSAGSVMMIRAEVLRSGARFTATEDVVGFCKEVRRRGFGIWVEPRATLYHPYVGKPFVPEPRPPRP